MKQPEDIQGIWQESLGQYEAEPEHDLWPAIEKRLAAKPVRRFVWLPYATAAASVIVMVSLIITLNHDPAPATEPITDHKSQADDPQRPAYNPSQPVQSQPVTTDTHDRTRHSTSGQIPVIANPIEHLQQIAQAGMTETQPQSSNPVEQLPQVAAVNLNEIPNMPTIDASVAQQTGAPEAIAVRNTAPQAVRTRYRPKSELDVKDLSVDRALAFATLELSKWAKSPINVYYEKGEGQEEVRTYQLDLFNLKITKKTHKQIVKQ
ncbi:MAG: hypothetical protein SF053_06415 [Bacteroidia bacterium]|nr:hypothetical protein [Bacteroidia bacterium]